MTFPMTSTTHTPGTHFTINDGAPQKVVSGWVGIYSANAQELRLFCVLLPGDTIANQPNCYAQALTIVRLEPSAQEHSAQPFIRHCFRLSQYSATARVIDFLFDVFRKLHDSNSLIGTSYALPLTQQQLAELLGMSAVHINRVLKTLQPLLRFQNHHIHIDEPEKIADMLQRYEAPLLH